MYYTSTEIHDPALTSEVLWAYRSDIKYTGWDGKKDLWEWFANQCGDVLSYRDGEIQHAGRVFSKLSAVYQF